MEPKYSCHAAQWVTEVLYTECYSLHNSENLENLPFKFKEYALIGGNNTHNNTRLCEIIKEPFATRAQIVLICHKCKIMMASFDATPSKW